jgi:ring-1,2-phenylacetyl-CoA epoxidase subunit PaaA
MRRLANKNETTKGKIQDAVDWMFPMALEWFGLPDDKKRHDDQLEYRIKGKSNDELRQDWMDRTIPFLKEIGIDHPAHYDEDADEYVIDYEFPVAFDEEDKEWLFDEPISWDDVIDRWRARGPANEKYVNLIQSGKVDVMV